MRLLAASMLLATSLHAADSDGFHYTLPPGWVDLADRAVDASRYPANAVHEARNGKYRIYAIDPDNLSDQGANALMNVVEIPQTAAVTSAVLARARRQSKLCEYAPVVAIALPALFAIAIIRRVSPAPARPT